MFSSRTALGLPLPPDRLFFAASAVLFLLDRRYSLRELRLAPVHLVALAVVCIAGLSALDHDILTTRYGFFALLDRLVVPYLVFTIAPVAFKREADRLLILKTLTVLGIYLGLTAVAEIFGPHALVFPRYIMDPSVGIQFGRARGPFIESEANGLTLLAALWCAVILARTTASRLWRYVAVTSALLSVVGSLLTLTRSIWLGLLFGALVLAVIDPKARRFLVPGALAVVAIAGIALLSSSSLSSKVDSRFNDAGSVYDRRNTNAAAVRAIEEHPLTGVGWVQFISVSGDYVRQNPDYPVTVTDIEVHNVVLSRTAELGLPGGFLWVLSVILGPVLAAVRRPRYLQCADVAVRGDRHGERVGHRGDDQSGALPPTQHLGVVVQWARSRTNALRSIRMRSHVGKSERGRHRRPRGDERSGESRDHAAHRYPQLRLGDQAPVGLKQQAIRSFAWTGFQTVSVRLLSLVTFIVLARLLTPHDYGVAAIAGVFAALAALLAAGGFSQAIVQKETLQEEDLDSVFWVGMLVGVALTAGTVILAWPLADFFRLPELRAGDVGVVTHVLGDRHYKPSNGPFATRVPICHTGAGQCQR